MWPASWGSGVLPSALPQPCRFRLLPGSAWHLGTHWLSQPRAVDGEATVREAHSLFFRKQSVLLLWPPVLLHVAFILKPYMLNFSCLAFILSICCVLFKVEFTLFK